RLSRDRLLHQWLDRRPRHRDPDAARPEQRQHPHRRRPLRATHARRPRSRERHAGRHEDAPLEASGAGHERAGYARGRTNPRFRREVGRPDAVHLERLARPRAAGARTGSVDRLALRGSLSGARQMKPVITDLVTRYETGRMSRRDLIQGLTMLVAAASAKGADSAPEATQLNCTGVDHVSVRVKDLKRSAEFYQSLFGLESRGEDKEHRILRLGKDRRVIVSLRQDEP